MAGLGDLLKRMSHYSLAQFAIMAAGLVSFPILTRVLSVAEYGIMGLIVMLLTFTSSLSKFGLQHSSVRLWAEHEGQPGGIERFTFTFFVGAFLFSIPVIAIYDGAVWLLRPWIGGPLTYFILLSSPLIFIQALSSFGTNLLRARQWSRRRAAFDVAQSYIAMVLAVLGATVVLRGLRGYYAGLMTGQAMVALVLVASVLRWTKLRGSSFSPSLLREAMAYGFPMGIAELFGALFHLGDRFIIQWMLDETAVGYYTMAFNLAMYVNTLFTLPMDMAAIPMYSALYEKEGPEATSEFLRKATRLFFMFAAPAIAGLWVIKEDIVALLASKQFLPGASLVHILLAGFLFYGSRTLLGAGMLLRKRVWLVANLELAGAVANLLLNLVLIPHLGIHGSALATLITQFLGSVIFYLLGARLLRVPIDVLALLRYLACAAGMGFVVQLIHVGPTPVRLMLRLAAGAGVYAGLLLAVDAEARRLVRKGLGLKA
jgi:O-antigen/teichoic acid export membrane protein